MTRFLLVPSPFLPASSWTPVSDALTMRGHSVAIFDFVGLLATGPDGYRHLGEAAGRLLNEPAVLVAHSGAGALVPSIAEARPKHVLGAIFVDALLPHPGQSWMETMPPKMAARLRRAATAGRAPPWPSWFPSEVLEGLLPDAAVRADLVRDAPRVPLAYLEEVAPNPSPGLSCASCAYLQLSPAYAAELAATERLGWRTAQIDADHLAIITRAELVAELIAEFESSFRAIAPGGPNG